MVEAQGWEHAVLGGGRQEEVQDVGECSGACERRVGGGLCEFVMVDLGFVMGCEVAGRLKWEANGVSQVMIMSGL